MEYADKLESFEQTLERMNVALRNEFVVSETASRTWNTGHIFGLPRSGTTLAYQLLARSRSVGYPSNVMAFFWQVPPLGAKLQQKLDAGSASLSLSSTGGRTPEPLDPHEFGYFWREVLGHDSNSLVAEREPWGAKDLQAVLDTVNDVFEAPTVYKNFLVPAHVDFLTNELERQKFIFIERDPVDVVASLVSLRHRIGIAPDAPFGTRPADEIAAYPDELSRVAHQVASLSIASRDARQWRDCLVISYSDLCTEPVTSTLRMLEHLGVASVADHALRTERLTPSRPQEHLKPTEVETIHAILKGVQ